jgi:RecG-like helicase
MIYRRTVDCTAPAESRLAVASACRDGFVSAEMDLRLARPDCLVGIVPLLDQS